MERDNTYEKESADEGLTLKKVGGFFKRGWLIILITTAIVVVLTAIVALPIKYFYKSDSFASTAVEFTYRGIERGADPDGGVLNTDNIISANVLHNAIVGAQLSDKITETSTLRSRLRVESVPTDEYVKLLADAKAGNEDAVNALRNYVMHPTKFYIVLDDPSALGLTDGEATTLLDKIVMAYYVDFGTRYAYHDPFNEFRFNLSEKGDKLEYVDIYDVYKAKLNSVKDYLATITENLPKNAASNYKDRISALQNDIAVLEVSYNKYNTYILANSVYRNRKLALQTLQASKATYSSECAAKKDYMEALLAQIEKFQPNGQQISSAEGVTTTVTYPDEYKALHVKYDEANREYELLTTRINNLNEHINKLEPIVDETTSPEALAYVDKMLHDDIEAPSTRIMNDINELIADYNESIFIASSVKQIQPAAVSRSTPQFSTKIVLLIAALSGLVVGCIVAGVLIARSNAKAKAKAKAADSADAAVEADADAKADDQKASKE